MPTFFSNCVDCNIYCRKIMNDNYEILRILNYLGLPNELGLKIINYSNYFSNCDLCGKKLCRYHSYNIIEHDCRSFNIPVNLCINCNYYCNNEYGR